jgi:hypothetical protein
MYMQPTTNFHVNGDQTVNGLRKITWLQFSVFRLKRQHLYICMLLFQYIYLQKTELMERLVFLGWQAINSNLDCCLSKHAHVRGLFTLNPDSRHIWCYVPRRGCMAKYHLKNCQYLGLSVSVPSPPLQLIGCSWPIPLTPYTLRNDTDQRFRWRLAVDGKSFKEIEEDTNLQLHEES